MTQSIVIVGAGFAGLWSALGAARALDAAQRTDGSIEIAVIAPEPTLQLRPRLHEASPQEMTAPLSALFEAVGIRFIAGRVDSILANERRVGGVAPDGKRFHVSYDRLVLAAGSELHRPEIPGLEHAHNIDQVAAATRLDAHLAALAGKPESRARNAVVVVGGGFTGIEIACELPGRLRAHCGDAAVIDVIVLERANVIGPDLGAGPRSAIAAALDGLGITVRLGCTVAAIDVNGVLTDANERIEAHTVIWTAGLRANPLTKTIDAPRDPLGRLHVARDLRVSGVDGIFATGDVACAVLDEAGNHALMSCQHAMTMGKFAGHNATADLLGEATLPYNQVRYVTCLDLGAWGAVYTEGWDRQVKFIGAEAKSLKHAINTQWIYPPPAERGAALAAADPNPAAPRRSRAS